MKNIINFLRIYWFFIWTNLNHLHQGCFVPSLVQIGPVVLEKKMKMWKVYRQTDGPTDRQTTDDRWSEKLTWAFSSGELKWLTLIYTLTQIIGHNLFIFLPTNLVPWRGNQPNFWRTHWIRTQLDLILGYVTSY